MLLDYLSTVKDHRQNQGKRYQLHHILLFSIFAILCNADSYRKIHSFIKIKYDILNKCYNLNWERIPAYTTIRNIIQGLDSVELETSFRLFNTYLHEQNSDSKYIAFDGKTLRGSFDHFNDKKAIQVFSAFTSGDIILAHEEINEKTNEIPTAQKLFVELGLSDYIFTLDAMHCQVKTLQSAVESNNDIIVQVKENQPTLLNDCVNVTKSTDANDHYQEPETQQRARIESRIVEVYDNVDGIDKQKWNLVKSIIKVERKRQTFNTKTKSYDSSDEISYYISTANPNAMQGCQAIRQHWGIENKNHYVKDVSMNEDASRIRINPQNFAKLRSFALNILRANKVTNIQLELFENCLKSTPFFDYIGIK
ncbi:ISAs1 family transposase [candidate division KSB1 bacterium]|nr:ISAs1 family transposase [candidate division KSB1 bacterium]